jgi:hypothetical protein
MFQAARSWWKSGRGQRTIRLFSFELTVSIWAQKRSSLSQVEGVKNDLLYNFEIYRRIAASHRAAIPCFRQRVDLILEKVGDRQPIESLLLRPSALAGMAPDQLTGENELLLRERFGDSTADKIGSVEFNLRTSDEATHQIGQLWFQFQRLDQSHGAVSDADRAAVRDAAVRILGQIEALESSAEMIERLTTELGIRSKARAGLGPATSCDEVWRTGHAYRGG